LQAVTSNNAKGRQVMRMEDMSMAQIRKEIEQANNVIANATRSRQFWLDEMSKQIALGNEVILREESK